MEPQGYLLFAISIPNFLLGAFILLRNIKDPVNVYFSSFAFTVGFWAFGLAGFIFSKSDTAALAWAKGYYIAAALIAISFAFFSRAFTQKKLTINFVNLYTVVSGVFIVSSLLLNPQFMLTGIAHRDWGKEVILNQNGYFIFTLYFMILVTIGFTNLVAKLATKRGIERTYIKFVTVGLSIAFLLGATFNLFYPFFGNYKYIWAGPLFTLVYIALVSYAIVKHKLFDIRLIVARSLAYGLSIFLLGLVFGVVVFGFVDKIVASNNLSDLTQEVLFTVVAISIAFVFQPLKTFFDRITNRLFYRDAYDAQGLIDELNQVIVSTIDLEKMIAMASEVLGKNLKPEFCVFGLKETEYSGQRIIGESQRKFSYRDIDYARGVTPSINHKVIVADNLHVDDRELQSRMRKNDVAVLVRLTSDINIEGIGYIVLGNKKSGNPYNDQDLKILEIIANELVIAIDNALRFEEIQKFNVTLEQKVEDATRRLRRANDKLITLDQTKDDFISMASHQLRTPLTSVKGYLSMVLEGDAGKLSAQQAKLLDQAFISSQRMVYLIADLLNVSRLRTGKFVVEASEVNLSEIIEGEVSQLVETAAARSLKLKYHKPKDFPQLMLDETKIRQVIMNFIDNAIYYTPNGGKIDVYLRDNGKFIEFTVQDNGIGVPKSEQHNLFSKFFRAGNARKARPDGTGLGLFMAKKVIVAQGGAVVFKSADGKGSTFGFTFEKSKLAVPSVGKTKEENS